MVLNALMKEIESDQKKNRKNFPKILVGDTIQVGFLIVEEDKKRIQFYEGVVIALHSAGINTTITVRRVFQGIGVERIFSVFSHSFKKLKIIRSAKVRKAKLYYLRQRVGKATRLKNLLK